MKVSPINREQQTFQGKVSRNFKTALYNLSRNEAKTFIEDANCQNEKIDIELIKKIVEKKDNILERFENFMAKLHKDTELFPTTRNRFILHNETTGSAALIDSTPNVSTYTTRLNSECDGTHANIEVPYYNRKLGRHVKKPELNLHSLEKLINGLEKLDPTGKNIDDIIHERYKKSALELAKEPSLISKIKTFCYILNADTVAKSFNKPSIKKDLQQASFETKHKQKSTDDIQKYNNKILKNMFK